MGIHTIVCIKSVVLDAPGGRVVRSSGAVAVNPFDMAALELALAGREALGGTVTALSMGPPAAAFSLYTALSMGVDRAVLLRGKALAGSDTLATSTALSAGIQQLAPYDLVLFGVRTSDSDTGQVGPQTATALGLPMAAQVESVKFSPGELEVEAVCDGFRMRCAVPTPCALTVSPEAASARNASLSGIEDAYAAQVETWGLEKLGLSPDQVGDAGSPTKVSAMTPAAKGGQCEFLEGSPEEQAQQLLDKLLDRGLVT